MYGTMDEEGQMYFRLLVKLAVIRTLLYCKYG